VDKISTEKSKVQQRKRKRLKATAN